MTAAGRRWYEIWVPQDPAAWARPKVVFRDIAEHPQIWVDLGGSVVNGDCYWLMPDAVETTGDELLWLTAAVGSSRFAQAFYDARFCNQLYAGRRRFITQYVEQFPLPAPQSPPAIALISLARELFEQIGESDTKMLEAEIEATVWHAFDFVSPTDPG